MIKTTKRVNFDTFRDESLCCKICPVFGIMSMVMTNDQPSRLGVLNML